MTGHVHMRGVLAHAVAIGALVVAAPGDDAGRVLGQAAPRLRMASAIPHVPVRDPLRVNPGPPPRSADGRPDLNGMWSFSVSTPVQRSPAFGNTLFLTAEAAAAYRAQIARASDRERRNAGDLEHDAFILGMNAAWFDAGGPLAENRTSLIVDPPDGRFPSHTPAAAARLTRCIGVYECGPTGMGPHGAIMTDQAKADHVTDRSIAERCLAIANGPPFEPFAYNSNVLILHRADSVAIQTEMIHSARTVWLDRRPRPDPSVGLWQGFSLGRWEGDTLVFETTNFRRDAKWLGVLRPERFTLVERLTRIDVATVLYEFTMHDPETWTRPWTVHLPMKKLDGMMYEYACHEGNYGLRFQLSATRGLEKQQSK